MEIMQPIACLVIDPTTIFSCGLLFNCPTVDQTSDPNLNIDQWVWYLVLVFGWAHDGSTRDFLKLMLYMS